MWGDDRSCSPTKTSRRRKWQHSTSQGIEVRSTREGEWEDRVEYGVVDGEGPEAGHGAPLYGVEKEATHEQSHHNFAHAKIIVYGVRQK